MGFYEGHIIVSDIIKPMTDERWNRPISSADLLCKIRTSSTGKFIAEISANKIGR